MREKGGKERESDGNEWGKERRGDRGKEKERGKREGKGKREEGGKGGKKKSIGVGGTSKRAPMEVVE